MGKYTLLVLVTIATLFMKRAWADCSSKDLVLDQSLVWDFSALSWKDSLLNYRPGAGFQDVGAVVEVKASKPPYIQFEFRFDLPKDILANSYNIYRLELDVGEGENLSHFESGNCDWTIGSFSPQDPFLTRQIKISPLNDGSARRVERVHLKVWGHQ